MSTILVTGSAAGLGKAMTQALRADGHKVLEYDIKENHDVLKPDIYCIDDFDPDLDTLDVLINNAGVNLINWLERFSEAAWDEVMDVNAKGIFMMTKACLPMLKRSNGTVLNIVSNAAHVPMTCSAAYNASKGAAHILTLQLARELTRAHGITVFGVAPNKLRGTEMSDAIDDQVVRTRGWTKEYAQEYQLKALLTGEETPPERVAEFVAFLLKSKDNHKYLTGTVIPYGA